MESKNKPKSPKEQTNVLTYSVIFAAFSVDKVFLVSCVSPRKIWGACIFLVNCRSSDGATITISRPSSVVFSLIVVFFFVVEFLSKITIEASYLPNGPKRHNVNTACYSNWLLRGSHTAPIICSTQSSWLLSSFPPLFAPKRTKLPNKSTQVATIHFTI